MLTSDGSSIVFGKSHPVAPEDWVRVEEIGCGVERGNEGRERGATVHGPEPGKHESIPGLEGCPGSGRAQQEKGGAPCPISFSS